MKEITLTKGFVTKVDDEDHEALNKYRWYASKCCNKWYAKTTIWQNGKTRGVYMHRMLLGLKHRTELCDHKDRDSLNNQKDNLRRCTWSQNQRNKTKKRNGTGRFIGITRTKSGSWLAQLTHDSKHVHIGIFKDDKDAALAYNRKALELHGEFANLNVIQ